VTVGTARSITELETLLRELPEPARAAAERIYSVSTTIGQLDAPADMHPWIERLFGSVDAVREQRIVRVTDLITLEGALFNELRARRPVEVKGTDEVRQTIESSADDPFCHPATGTPADTFGRVQGLHAVTASNIAKYDAHHGVIVFDRHDPLASVDAAMLRDYLSVGRRWAEAAHREDSASRYYFPMWNALWRAGASIVHGHMQVLVTRGLHYPKVERLRRQASEYAAAHGASYFDDVWSVHEALGLGTEVAGTRAFASLTPVKERELVFMGRPGRDEQELAEAVAAGIALYRRFGVAAFNLAFYLPPLSPDGLDWGVLPPLARLVDRGDPASKVSDIGSMELYAAAVVAADPFQVSNAFRSELARL
jgi:hypothetical protein